MSSLVPRRPRAAFDLGRAAPARVLGGVIPLALLAGLLLGLSGEAAARPGPQLHIDVCGAARRGDLKELRRLLAKVSDLDAAGEDGADFLPAPIVCAAQGGSLAGVQFLLGRGAKLEAGYWAGEKVHPNDVLVAGGGGGNLELVKWLLDQQHLAVDRRARGSEMTAVLAAAAAGDLAMLELLLARGARLDAVDVHGRTALHHAVSGKPEVVALALARGARLDAQDALGYTALHRAILYPARSPEHQLAIIDQLLAARAPLEAIDKKGLTPLLALFECESCTQSEPLRERLIAAGASVNVKDPSSGVTPLHLAVRRDDEQLVVRLLDRKADPEAASSYGTPLMEARSKAVAERLLARGAKINARDDSGRAALLAAGRISAELMLLMLDRGADPGATTTEGFTPLMVAAQQGYLEVVKRLLQKKVALDARSKTDGWSALQLAAGNRRTEVVTALLGAGAAPALRDTAGRTALDHARAVSAGVIARLLAPLTPFDPAYPRYPFLSEAALTPEALADFSLEELVIARNEVYARHGYSFKNAELAAHFAAQRWYKPDPAYDEKSLTERERENIRLLLAAEKARKNKSGQGPSGKAGKPGKR